MVYEAIRAIDEYTSGFTSESWHEDCMRYDATLRQPEIVGEACNHLSQELTDQNPEIPWHDIAGFRNIVVHEYLWVDEYLVWNFTKYNLPILRTKLMELLGE